MGGHLDGSCLLHYSTAHLHNLDTNRSPRHLCHPTGYSLDHHHHTSADCLLNSIRYLDSSNYFFDVQSLVAVDLCGSNQLAAVSMKDPLAGFFLIFDRWATATPKSRCLLGSEADPVLPDCRGPVYWYLIHL